MMLRCVRAATASFRQPLAARRAPTPDQVALYTDDPGRLYTAIDSDCSRRPGRSGRSLRIRQTLIARCARASELRANAVINVRYEHLALGDTVDLLPDLRKRDTRADGLGVLMDQPDQ